MSSPAENDATYRDVLGLILENVHVGVSNDFIVIGDATFDAPAPIRKALVTLMDEWVDGEATRIIPPVGTAHATPTKTSGEVVDLLAALQKSFAAAKSARGETAPIPPAKGGAA